MDMLIPVLVLVGCGAAPFAFRVLNRDRRRHVRRSPTQPDDALGSLRRRSWNAGASSSGRPLQVVAAQTASISVEGLRPIAFRTVLSGACRVVDGDTIMIDRISVRLHGIDAPELDHPYGQNAKRMLIGLCRDQIVRAEVESMDVHGRAVARCFLPDGRELSAEMVRAGLAIDWPKHSGGQYRSLEAPGIREKLWRADARQKGRFPGRT